MLAKNYSLLYLDLTIVIIQLLFNYFVYLYCHKFNILKVNSLNIYSCTSLAVCFCIYFYVILISQGFSNHVCLCRLYVFFCFFFVSFQLYVLFIYYLYCVCFTYVCMLFCICVFLLCYYILCVCFLLLYIPMCILSSFDLPVFRLLACGVLACLLL